MVHYVQRTYAHSTVVKTVYVISSSAKENPSDLILMDSTKEEIDLYLSSTYYSTQPTYDTDVESFLSVGKTHLFKDLSIFWLSSKQLNGSFTSKH